MGPLTFEVNLELEEDKHVYLAAVNDQAKLMRGHYHLGHLAFSKLKQLALNGKDSLTSGQGQASCLCGTPFWCHDKSALERTRDLL
jgi:hypothetical protein